jgi:hypothetical protein
MRAGQKLVAAILERAPDIDGRRKLTCAEAFEIARKFRVKLSEIGLICNRYNIRISACQLGCFA